jgi:hypothetical protein
MAADAALAEALTKPLVLRGKKALPLLARFPGTEAVVIPEIGPLGFSRGFKPQTRWREISSS